MNDADHSRELERAVARSDYEKLCAQLDAYIVYFSSGEGEWPEDKADDFSEIVGSGFDDQEKAFAYVILGADRTDDAAFLGYLGCGVLEDILRDPSEEMLARIVAEAKSSARFRWLLSNPYKVAVAERAWTAIEGVRFTGPHEEPSDRLLPPRH